MTPRSSAVRALPPQPGVPVNVLHHCNGQLCTGPFTPTQVTRMGGITGTYRLTGHRCDGTPMQVILDADGHDVDASPTALHPSASHVGVAS